MNNNINDIQNAKSNRYIYMPSNYQTTINGSSSGSSSGSGSGIRGSSSGNSLYKYHMSNGSAGTGNMGNSGNTIQNKLIPQTRLPSIQYLLNDIQEKELSTGTVPPIIPQWNANTYIHPNAINTAIIPVAIANPNSNIIDTTTTTTTTNSIIMTKKKKEKKKRSNLPKNVVSKLNKWLSEHMNNPYPTLQEKLTLIEETGLNSVQLSNWFINVRRRKVFSEYYKLTNNPMTCTTTNLNLNLKNTVEDQENARCLEAFDKKRQKITLEQLDLHHQRVLQDDLPQIVVPRLIDQTVSSTTTTNTTTTATNTTTNINPITPHGNSNSLYKANIADDDDLNKRFRALPLTRRKKLIDRLEELKKLTKKD